MAIPYRILFNPLAPLRITQGEGYNVGGVKKCTFSHTDRGAVDEGGADTGRSWCAQPKNGPDLKVTKVWHSESGCNGTFNLSQQKCILADGRIETPCLEMLHCDEDRYQSLGIKVGKVFAAGSNFYSEGKRGATAYHLHMQCGIGTTIVKNSVGGWKFKDELHPYRACWLEPGTKTLSTAYNYPWVYWPEENLPIGEVTIKATYKRRKGPGTSYAQLNDGSGNLLTAVPGTYAVWKVEGDCYCIRPGCQLAYGGGTSEEEWICCGANGVYKPWASDKKKYVTIVSGRWNVRKGPGTGYGIVKVVSGGTKHEYTAIENGWYKLSDGYISPSAVSVTSEE